jgi:4-amino-4-deoxy-L-arabinose transferase-like glycosyltransferase
MRTPGVTIFALIRLLWTPPTDSSPATAASLRSLARSWLGGGLALVLLCLTVYLPGIASIPPVDRDESRFAQASRQMFESGDYVVPRIKDRPRLNKPPLIYWLQCGSIALFGDAPGQHANANIWVFRVPSVLCAIAAVLLTWRLGLRLMDARAALLGAALLAVCPIVVWDAHQARADQLLLATTTASMFALVCVWRSTRHLGHRATRPWVAPLTFWLAMGAGVLAKGPITPLVAGLTILAVCMATRRWRWVLAIRPVLGILVLALVVGPWVYAVATRIGWDAYLAEIYRETIGRSRDAMEGHWGLPGYHLLLLCAIFWPGVLCTGKALARAMSIRRRAPMPRVGPSPAPALLDRVHARMSAPLPSNTTTFLACWIVPNWLVFEFVATKLPHYTLPMYPAIALLSARFVVANTRLAPSTLELGDRIWLTIGWIMALAAAACVAIYAAGGLGAIDWRRPMLPVDAPRLIAAGLCVLVAITLLVIIPRRLRRFGPLGAQLPSIAVAALLASVLLSIGASRLAIVPGADTPAIIGSLADRRTGELLDGSIASTFHEDSVIFWTRGRAERVDPDKVDDWFRANPAGIAIIDVEQPVEIGLERLHTRGYSTGPVLIINNRPRTTASRAHSPLDTPQ